MSIPQRTGFAQLPRIEGWEVVVAPAPIAKQSAGVKVKVALARGTMRLSVSLSPVVVEQLGHAEFVSVHQNKAEQALMLIKSDEANGFKLSAFGGNFSKNGAPKRRICYLEPWKQMTSETVELEANHEVIEWKGAPALVIRLPYGLFPKTGLGARS